MFADFLHTHPLQVSVIGLHERLAAPESSTRQLPDSVCAICQWQKVGTRLQATVSAGPATLLAPTTVALANMPVPDNPIPHPSAFRGPPAISLL